MRLNGRKFFDTLPFLGFYIIMETAENRSQDQTLKENHHAGKSTIERDPPSRYCHYYGCSPQDLPLPCGCRAHSPKTGWKKLPREQS